MENEQTFVMEGYIQSAPEYDEFVKKFPAFANAELSDAARREQGVYESDTYEAGYYPLRSPSSGASNHVEYGDYDGARDWIYSNYDNGGLRLALQLIYNQECSLAKGCQEVSRTAKVCIEGKVVTISGKAPVITYGGKQYIWTNKERCESGQDETMVCVSLKLLERAKPVDKKGKHNDFGKATELREQCNRLAAEGCTLEENAMRVPVEFSKADNYEKARPMLAQKKQKFAEGSFDEKFDAEQEVKRLKAKLAAAEERHKKAIKEASRWDIDHEEANRVNNEFDEYMKKDPNRLKEFKGMNPEEQQATIKVITNTTKDKGND